MTVKAITDKALWDKFVDDSPYGMLFHKWDFLKTIEKHTGDTLLPYGVYKGDELICIFPLFLRKYMGMKMIFSPPPRTGVPNLGFVMSGTYDSLKQRRKESYINTAMDEIDQEIKKPSPNYISIATVTKFNDIRPFKWHEYTVNVLFSYVIDLTRPLEEIWQGFDMNCKKNIKLCEKFPLVSKESTDIKKFYGIMSDRYRQQGLNYPVLSPEYLKDLMDAYPENLKLYFLYNGDEVVGIDLICQYKGRIMLWMGESIINKDIPANYFTRWEMIKKAKAEGFKEMEIEGANTKRLCANKSRFNPRLDRSFHITKKDALGKVAEWTYQNLLKKKALTY
jgi:hypothetical protein